MEDLHTYIGQTRQRGQTDQHISRTLVDAGWDARQVAAALGKGPAPLPIERKSKGLSLVIAAVLVFIIIGTTYALSGHWTTRQSSLEGFAAGKGEEG